jgi:demethylmenaquinone methyltransferase/2-methoxy-6-polyprenyl-1,4-benzoquinol methylase
VRAPRAAAGAARRRARRDPRDHRPRGLLAPFYRLWFDGLVPLLGKILPGGSAYTYLPASVRRFPGPEELAGLLRASGFEDVRWRAFAGGIVALHIGVAA